MYLGQIVEVADWRDLYNAPAHPYTRMLLAAIPSCVPGAIKQPIMIRGETGDRADGGCRFYNRCIYKIDICQKEKPALMPAGQNRWSACHRTGEI